MLSKLMISGWVSFWFAMGVSTLGAADYGAEISTALEGLKAEKAEQPRKLLVFSVTRGFRHKSIPTGQMAVRMLGEITGAYKAVVSDDLENFEPGKIDQFDAICFLNTTLEVFSPEGSVLAKMNDREKGEAVEREGRLKKSLMDFIKKGGGFVGIHAATDTFYNWPEYGDMIGGYFDGHPWGSDTEVSVKVEEGQKDHACCAHLEGGNLEFKEEIYQFKAPYDVNKVQVLLRLDPEKTDISRGKREDKDYPVSWLKHHGKGRVFYCSLGHNDHIYSNSKVLQHYARGIQWVLGDLDFEVKTGDNISQK